MTLTEIKNSLFGYNKNDVCRYVSELNEIHTAQTKALEDKLSQQSEEFGAKNSTLANENVQLKQSAEALNEEIENLKKIIHDLNNENNDLRKSYKNLEDEVSDLRSKSDVISTAIINAEKCASTMIDDATSRANSMIAEAEDKVDVEVKRLVTAKEYISEIRASVALTMKNIDNALSAAENNIETKRKDLTDTEDKKMSAREKFELLEKNIFKRA